MLTAHVRANTILLALVLAALIAMIAMFAAGVRGGTLDPPGPPASTELNIDTDARTEITSIPFNATTGSYYLTQNLYASADGQDGIVIMGSDVTIDLNGFMIQGSNQTGHGVTDPQGGHNNVTIAHGTVDNFAEGIYLSDTEDVVVRDLVVEGYGLANVGIRVGARSLVEDCTAKNGGGGVVLGLSATMRRCLVSGNAGNGVYASTGSVIEDSTLIENGTSGSYANVWVAGFYVIIRDSIFFEFNYDIMVTPGGGDLRVIDSVLSDCSPVGFTGTPSTLVFIPLNGVVHSNVTIGGYC